jgi:F-type H+-transporting ATPase subunit gamma
MPSLKEIRKRIASVKSTQKITRAMKMVAGARLNRAQQRITELRPYAVKTQEVLSEVTSAGRARSPRRRRPGGRLATRSIPCSQVRPERRVLLVVLTSDRGLCGASTRTSTSWPSGSGGSARPMARRWRCSSSAAKGATTSSGAAPRSSTWLGVWDDLGWDSARQLGRKILQFFLRPDDPVDAIYLVYNEFKSAMTQKVTVGAALAGARAGGDRRGAQRRLPLRAQRIGAARASSCRCTSRSRFCAPSTSRWRASSVRG